MVEVVEGAAVVQNTFRVDAAQVDGQVGALRSGLSSGIRYSTFWR
jgi:hypothetical protein